MTQAPSERGRPFSAWCWPQAPCVRKTCRVDGVDVALGFRRSGYHSELKATTPRWHFEPISRNDAQHRVPQNRDVARPLPSRDRKREEAGRRARARSDKRRRPRLGPAPRRRLWTRAVQVPAAVREVPELIQKVLGEPLVARAAHDEELDALRRVAFVARRHASAPLEGVVRVRGHAQRARLGGRRPPQRQQQHPGAHGVFLQTTRSVRKRPVGDGTNAAPLPVWPNTCRKPEARPADVAADSVESLLTSQQALLRVPPARWSNAKPGSWA